MKKYIILLYLLSSLNIIAQTTKNSKVLIPFRVKNLWGLSDTLGTIKVAPVYKEIKDYVISYEQNFTSRYVVKTNKTYFVIDQNKKILLPELNTYDSIKLNKYNLNHFWVYKKGKVGLFHNNKEIIPCLYDNINMVQNKSYELQKGKLSGLLNSQGKLIIPIEYKDIHASWDDEDEKNPKFVWVAEGMLVEKKFYDTKIVEKNTDNLVIDKMIGVEEIVVDESDYKKNLSKKYDSFEVLYRDRNYAIVKLNNKKGVVKIDTEEEEIKPIYDDVAYFAEDKEKIVFKVKVGQKYGLIKEGNHVVLEIEYDNIEYFYKTGLYLIEKDNKKGCIVFNTIYPYIKPKYLSINPVDGIQVSNRWQFGLFEVTTEKGIGLVGENGVEFFKD